MRNALLHSALRDFGAPGSGFAAFDLPQTGFAGSLAIDAPFALTALDPEDAVAEAVAQAEAALRLELEIAHQDQIEALRAAHQAELDQLVQEMGQAAAARIDAGFANLASELSVALSTRVAHLLAPFLTQAQSLRAAEALAEAVQNALIDRNQARVRASGPRELWQQLQPALARAGIAAEWQEGADVDLSVGVGDSLWQTRLGAWMSELEQVVGEEQP